MKKFKTKNFLIMLTMATLPVASFFGAITSTLAWYAYSSMAVLDYHGTAVSISDFLQVGIHSDLRYLEEVGLKIEDGVAWSEPGAGLKPEQISVYLRYMNYATDSLTPLTSGPYEGGEDLVLTAAPSYGVPYNPEVGAKTSYAFVPLAFRVLDASGNKKKNAKVWLTNSDIMCREYEDLKNGVRLHFKGNTNTFIYHPSAEEAGKTALAGLQDLNEDKFYDWDYNTNEEIMYGLYDGEIHYTHITEDTGLDDLNKTGHTSESTFCSKHRANENVVLSYDRLTFEHAHYEAISSVAPIKDEEGNIVNPEAIKSYD